jgi:hypothetical protein
VNVLELKDGLLQLPIEHEAVGDAHHLVEDLPIGRVLEA